LFALGTGRVESSDNRQQKEAAEVEYPIPAGQTHNADVTVPSKETPREAHNSLKVLTESGSSRKRRGMKIETVEDRVEEAYQILRKMCERAAKDECSLYAELLANKLRALEDNKREIVMHEISDLMFRAKTQKSKLSVPRITTFQCSRRSALYCS
jgi:chromosomal replication initiation ATPase DnaA